MVTCLKSLHTNIYICDDMHVCLTENIPQYAHIIPIILIQPIYYLLTPYIRHRANLSSFLGDVLILP